MLCGRLRVEPCSAHVASTAYYLTITAVCRDVPNSANAAGDKRGAARGRAIVYDVATWASAPWTDSKDLQKLDDEQLRTIYKGS